MSDEIEVKKLCDLSKLEIQEDMIIETSNKIHDVMLLFNKLDELDIRNSGNVDRYDSLRIEKSINCLRDDTPRETSSGSDSREKFKFLNTKNGFVLGPRI